MVAKNRCCMTNRFYIIFDCPTRTTTAQF
uniref:Uncharacterized protein n=2 Tax=gambiae species complex TaxID=44542 RepID=A0A9I3BDB1_ANOCL